MIDIVFDASKDAQNVAKHGLSLGEATEFRWEEATFKQDTRKDYGETRIIGTSTLRGRIHVMVFTVREGTYRIISLRKANHKERKNYEKETGI